MDPRHLFADQRLIGFCVYCGGPPETSDHVPSKVLLDEPYPNNLPVVECCTKCNTKISLHEEYLACFISCVLAGSVRPDDLARSKIARILTDKPALATQIASSMTRSASNELLWTPEMDRVRIVMLKLARGHLAYELTNPRIDQPVAFNCTPLSVMTEEDADNFLNYQETRRWPEIGSRAFIRMARSTHSSPADHWQIVQNGQYQYLVSQSNGDLVRILLGNYLACEVRWD